MLDLLLTAKNKEKNIDDEKIWKFMLESHNTASLVFTFSLLLLGF